MEPAAHAESPHSIANIWSLQCCFRTGILSQCKIRVEHIRPPHQDSHMSTQLISDPTITAQKNPYYTCVQNATSLLPPLPCLSNEMDQLWRMNATDMVITILWACGLKTDEHKHGPAAWSFVMSITLAVCQLVLLGVDSFVCFHVIVLCCLCECSCGCCDCLWLLWCMCHVVMFIFHCVTLCLLLYCLLSVCVSGVVHNMFVHSLWSLYFDISCAGIMCFM